MIGTIYDVSSGPPHSILFQPQVWMTTTQARIRGTAHSASGILTGYSDSLFTIATPTAVEAISTAAAPRFELQPNSPNPFNPATTIAGAASGVMSVAPLVQEPRAGSRPM